MKNIIKAILALALFACGASPEDENVVEGDYIPIGSTGQEIFMPTGYGAENGSGTPQCSPPWGGGICRVPDSKTLLYKLFASTCSSWWQARVVGAEAYVQPFLDGLGDDWNYSGEVAGLYNIDIRCTASSGLADFNNLQASTDNHATEFGTLQQWVYGSIRIDTAEIEAQPGWASKTEAQRIRFAENIIRHEYGHSFGFGHGGTGLMRDGSQWTEAQAYGSTMTFGTTERNMLLCYNEDSGSTDDC